FVKAGSGYQDPIALRKIALLGNKVEDGLFVLCEPRPGTYLTDELVVLQAHTRSVIANLDARLFVGVVRNAPVAPIEQRHLLDAAELFDQLRDRDLARVLIAHDDFLSAAASHQALRI